MDKNTIFIYISVLPHSKIRFD